MTPTPDPLRCRWCGLSESEHGPSNGKPVYGGVGACEWDMQSTFFTPWNALTTDAQPAPALDLDSLRAAVEALPTYGHLVPRGDEPSADNAMLHRAAVLALFDPQP